MTLRWTRPPSGLTRDEVDLNSLRSHNPFLPPLASVDVELREYVNAVVGLVPQLAESLIDLARYFAGELVAKYNRRTSEQNVQLLALCIFDLQLNQLLGYFQQELQDEAVAGGLMGAVAYQALGQAPRSDDQSIFVGMSHRLRGPEKYAAVARMYPAARDPVDLTFGREFGQLIFGRTTDDVVLLGKSKLLAISLYTEANLRGIFFGEEVDDAARARIEARCAERDQQANREIQEWRRRNPGSGL